MRTRIIVTLLGLGLTVPGLAQTSSSDPGETQSARKKCDTLKQRIAKEQSSLAAFEQTIAADKKGRETCSTKPMCARYDQAIKAMEARKSEHQTRLSKLKSDAVEACKSS
jgi:hypothetical protein